MDYLIGDAPAGLVLAVFFGALLGWLLGRFLGLRKLRHERLAAHMQIVSSQTARDLAAREVRRLKSSLAEAEAAQTELASQLQDGGDMLARRDRTIETLIAEVNDAKADQANLDELRKRLDEHRKTLAEFDRERTPPEHQRETSAKADSLKVELAACRRRVEELESANAMLSETETSLTAELAHASKTVGSLQEQLAQASSEKNKLDAAVHQIRGRQQGHPSGDELKSKVAQLESLNRQLDSERQTVAKLRSELEQARRELADSRGPQPSHGEPPLDTQRS